MASSRNRNRNNNNKNNQEAVVILENGFHEGIDKMFHEAVAAGDIDKVKQYVLADGADVNCKNSNGDGAAHVAISKGDFVLLKSLIEDLGAALNVQDENKSDLIKHAFICDELSAIQLLMKHGAPIDTVNAIGNTLLHTCAIYNSPLACAFLLDSDLINVNARSVFYRTPLHCACMFFNYDIVRLLCDRTDVELSAVDVDGETPFFWACNINNYDNCDICEFLVQRGCDINIRDKYNRSPLDVACNNYSYSTIQLLLSQTDLDTDISSYTFKLLKNYRFLD